jgi:hypothetical protein
MENTKLIRSATLIDRILKILQGFALAGVAVAAIFIPLTAIFGEKIIASSNGLTLGALELKLAGDPGSYLEISNIKVSIIVMLVCAILASAATWYCLKVLREILSPMKDGHPFAEGISDKIRKLGWTVLVAGGITEVGRMLSEIFEVRAYQIGRLLNQAMVESITYKYSMNLWFVVTALILFFLSYVFRSGEALQKEADETL